MSEPSDLLEYQEWLKKAAEDEFAAAAILKAGPVPAPVCFHYHQMAEKLLKGLMVFLKIEYPKSHDLVVIATLLKPAAPEIDQLKPALELLDPYAVDTRYPGDAPEITMAEAEQAGEAARQVKDFVTKRTGA